MQNLNDVIPQQTGWTVETGAYMLDNGDVIGQAVNPSNQGCWYVIHPTG
jgi:hypothetical protein